MLRVVSTTQKKVKTLDTMERTRRNYMMWKGAFIMIVCGIGMKKENSKCLK